MVLTENRDLRFDKFIPNFVLIYGSFCLKGMRLRPHECCKRRQHIDRVPRDTDYLTGIEREWEIQLREVCLNYPARVILDLFAKQPLLLKSLRDN